MSHRCSRCQSHLIDSHGDVVCLMCGTLSAPLRAWEVRDTEVGFVGPGEMAGQRRRRGARIAPPVVTPGEQLAWAREGIA